MPKRPLRCGLVADTHGRFDPALARIFRGVDVILHAGDVGDDGVLRALARLAPVRAVRGNVDRRGACARLPSFRRLVLGGVPTLLLHRLGRPEEPAPEAATLLARVRPRLVVFGHSHVPEDVVVDGVRFVNPGSAGPRRFRLPRCCALLTIGRDGRRIVRFRFLDEPGCGTRATYGKIASFPREP